MKRSSLILNILAALSFLVLWMPVNAAPIWQSSAAAIQVLDRNNQPVTQIVDGDSISIKIELGQKVDTPTVAEFLLDEEPVSKAGCEIPAGESGCQSVSFPALGWYWRADGAQRSQGSISAEIAGSRLETFQQVQIAPRPVIMVHGFVSDWHAWADYLGPQGYLARIGIQGFAVGDGQVPGILNTGSLLDPSRRTNTIAENARIVGDYVEAVRKLTGAQQVDLLGHSMGGLISRFYIDKYLEGDGVGQLIMLGSPMAGTSCANLPASLGLYLPAVLEIRPSYVKEIFNQQITHRKGVPFFMLAGTPIVKALQAPCTDVPTDVAVSVSSATSIPLHAQELPVLHTSMNTSEVVFEEFVAPLLRTPAGLVPEDIDPLLSPPGGEIEQFTRVYTGKVAPGESQEVVVPIEAGVTLANFALFDTTRSLQVRVIGASGKEVILDVEKNGLIQVDDPETLVYLGYGFENPRPGNWRITLLPSEKTPPEGAQFAITARFTGGARLNAATDQLLPQINQPVGIHAQLEQTGQSLSISEMTAVIQSPGGAVDELPLAAGQDGAYAVEWSPGEAGLYGIEVRARGRTAEGLDIDRAAFLTVEAQPPQSAADSPGRVTLAWVLVIGILIIGIAAMIILVRILRLARSR